MISSMGVNFISHNSRIYSVVAISMYWLEVMAFLKLQIGAECNKSHLILTVGLLHASKEETLGSLIIENC